MIKTNLYLHLFSFILLFAVLISNQKSPFKKVSDLLFVNLIRLNMVLVVVDLFSRFEGLAHSFFPVFTHTGNFLLYLLSPLITIIWFLYLDYQIYQNEKRLKNRAIALGSLFIINAFFTIGTIFFGWYYTISADNIYTRGPLFIIHSIVNITLVLLSIISLILNYKRLEKNHFLSYLFFVLMPALGMILQILVYGIAFTLSLVTISIVIVYINVQNQRINMDYLTNLYNRRQLDHYVSYKIDESMRRKNKFCVILIDLDNFKAINDIHGHYVGDEALKNTAKILKKAVSNNSFVARFGGDEFYIVTDIDNSVDALNLINDIENKFDIFNSNNNEYKIEFSYGFIIYDDIRHSTLVELHQAVDQKMYTMKEERQKAYKKSLQ